MGIFPLNIFPEGGLAGSIITTVWVGVFVMCFFNLRYGWVLSGLVVPGYLVPLFIVKPLAGVVISIEAILTYLIVYLFSEKLAPGRFPSLFGRDRFMGLILASIVVRLSFDGFILPEFSLWLEDNFDRRIDWQSNLQSFGLVVISLMANQFWKPGLGRGLVMGCVTIGLTYLIVRYGLMEFTNFRISGVYYLYEGLASSILASPKAYIILTLTALIASHYNVKYGWDFSGILIPALIALQWYEPTKILTSFGEAIIIYCVARLILKLPFMANVTLEGGRKLLLFFNISFAWKMMLGWVVIWQGLDLKTSDFFGFGYLLSTLIAIKAHDKDIFPRVARSTLQVSLAGAVLGNFVGFSLSAATARAPWNDSGPALGVFAADETPKFNSLVVTAVGDAHMRNMRRAAQPLDEVSRVGLARLIELLEEGIAKAPEDFSQRAQGWHVAQIEGARLAIVRDDGKGSELLVFDPNASRDEAIVLPDPTALPGLTNAALAIHRNQNMRWLVIAAPVPNSNVIGQGVAEIFAQTTQSAQIFVQVAPDREAAQLSAADDALAAINVAALRTILPDMSVGLAEETQDQTAARATLSLSENSVSQLARQAARFASLLQPRRCELSRKDEEAGQWSDLRKLAFVRFEIAEPLIRRVREGKAPYAAGAAARISGLEIKRCRFGQKAHWSLSSQLRDEGNIFLAEGEVLSKAVLTFENSRGMLPARIGATVHRNWQSNALFVATRSDSFLRDPQTIYDVVWQEWARNQDTQQEPMVLQLRARPREAMGYPGGTNILVAPDRIGPRTEELDRLVSSLQQTGLQAEVVENSRDQAGMEARPGMSMRFIEGIGERRYAIGWLMFAGLGEQATSSKEVKQ